MKPLTCIAIIMIVAAFSVNAQTTGFSYQGTLSVSGVPANGNFDLGFKLFDAVSGGVQQGPTNTRSNVAVANGAFGVTLDFGASPFSGADRFLEITVTPVTCPTPPCAATILSPRSQVHSVPYAIRASTVTGPITATSSLAALVVTNTDPTGAAIRAEANGGGPIFRGNSDDPSSANPKFIVTTIGQVRATGSVFARGFHSNSGFFGVTETGNMTVGTIDTGTVTTSGDATVGGMLGVTGGLSVGQGGIVNGLLTTQGINSAGITANGNVLVNGTFTVSGSKNNVVKLNDGRSVLLYANESPEYWYEDFGTVQLKRGRAIIAIDPTFAKVTNTGIPYKVFLTPNGNTPGLYVTRKTATTFEVRESRGGRSSISFDYRIVAKRRGYETVRFEAPSQ